MDIRKSDGRLEEFDLEKLKGSICAAYSAIGERCNDILLDTVAENFYRYNGMHTTEIRKQVEEWLMTVNKKAAKAYIENNNDGKDIRKKQDFIRSYIEASNAATGSKFDANANVSKKNIVTLGQELYKENNIRQNRYILTSKIASMYSKKLARQYLSDLESHVLYKHDETGTPGYPYTYSSKEVVEVVYNGKSLLLPFDLLYDIVDEPEALVDGERIVYQKTPENLFVRDLGGNLTGVTKLTRKKRHRPLVRVKTSYGEDVVVTDNHPMIVDKDNVEETVEAKDVLGMRQYKDGFDISFGGLDSIDLERVLPALADARENGTVKRHISAGRDLGYIVGFFTGSGYYEDEKTLCFIQDDNDILEHVDDMMREVLGVSGTIRRVDELGKYVLELDNECIYELFGGYFMILGGWRDRTLPCNILEHNEDFAKGCLEGLVDSEGVVSQDEDGTHVSIRFSSRACVQQAAHLFRHFGYAVENFSSIAEAMWGVDAIVCPDSERLDGSFKVSESDSFSGEPGEYKTWGYVKVTDVEFIDEGSAFCAQNDFIYDITTVTHTFLLNNVLVHNCVAITMYPFLLDGLVGLGGISTAPTDLKSFCGEFINLVYSVSSQFLGAVATPEFLMYMDYFIRKDYGDDYLSRINEVVDFTVKRRTLEKVIENCFQQVVHSMNMPAGNRGYQTVFWNISYFDHEYFKGVFGDFRFPDGTAPKWETLSWLQKKFMTWFNEERTKYVLTFPVETMALLTDGGSDFIDKEYADFTAEMWSEGHSFFCYLSNSPDSLSSCCRLRNSLKDLDESDESHNHTTHQYSMGTASVSTGSKSVMTINLPRLVQNAANRYYHEVEDKNIPQGFQMPLSQVADKDKLYAYIREDVAEMVERVHKYQTAFNETIKDFLKAGMLDVYNAGFIDIRKQYLTVGVNGITDAAEFFGIKVSVNDTYKEFVNNILETINMMNRKDKTRDTMFNCEFVPAENLAAKNYKWDKKDGYWVSPDRNLYSSYFYNPEDDGLSVIDKMKLHGEDYVKYLDGGSALHANLREHLSKEQYRHLLNVAAENGCNYFTYNIMNSCCEDCGHIDKHTVDKCPVCGGERISYLTRVIGYLKKINSFSEARQIEAGKRFYM